MFTEKFVSVQNLKTEMGEALVDKFRQEDGEIASQMIVLAMLVGAAAALKLGADGPLNDLVDDVIAALGGGEG